MRPGSGMSCVPARPNAALPVCAASEGLPPRSLPPRFPHSARGCPARWGAATRPLSRERVPGLPRPRLPSRGETRGNVSCKRTGGRGGGRASAAFPLPPAAGAAGRTGAAGTTAHTTDTAHACLGAWLSFRSAPCGRPRRHRAPVPRGSAASRARRGGAVPARATSVTYDSP